MSTPIAHIIAAVFSLSACLTAQASSQTSVPASPDPEILSATIGAARRGSETSFELQIDCTTDEDSRSLRVFPSGVATWSGRMQIALDEGARTALLETLLDHDFPQLAPRYGGRPESPGEAALRISCRIELDIDGLHKSSIQLVDGEQSPHLTALAAALLDLVEPLADAGRVADDLEDGLRKLADGELAPEALELRWVRLPSSVSEAPGTIVRIEAGRVSRQAYSPGRDLGEVMFTPLDPLHLLKIVGAVHQAEIWTWPPNLWSDVSIELEVRVLDQQSVIIARPFRRLSPGGQGRAQEQLDRLVPVLLDFERSPR